MKKLNIDIETYSSVNLKECGLYKYVQSADFEVLLFAYAIDGGEVQVVDLKNGEFIPAEVVQAMTDSEVLKSAYNAAFEWYCLSKHFRRSLPLNQWRCSMVHATYCGYPAGLGATGKALGIDEDKRKLWAGSALIRTFCVPKKPTKKNAFKLRTLPQDEPEKWQLFKEYCRQDVVAEMEIERRLSIHPMSQNEWSLWTLDMTINARGICVDEELIDGALQCDAKIVQPLIDEAVALTGLENPNSVAQLKKWLAEETGDDVDSLAKDKVAALIPELTSDKARRMLEIRQGLSKTSIKKYLKMKNAVGLDGRVRGLLQFYGANRTGRWAGRLVQVQNLPRNLMPALDLARNLMRAKNTEAIRMIYGSVPDTLSQLIRTVFVPAKGNKLIISDYSAIEARVIAWLAGEQWRQEVFETHGKIYEASAAQMFGVPLDLIKKGNPEYELRAKGKVAELALGYQGSVGALIAMGAEGMGLTEQEMRDIVSRWRERSPRIVDLWYSLDSAAVHVVRTGESIGLKGLVLAREFDDSTRQDFLTIRLPSGRKLFYVRPYLKENRFGRAAVHYKGLEQGKWSGLSTYGGKLTENVVQAIARDCLAEAIKRTFAAGYEILMHIHDEIVFDVPEDRLDMDEINRIMGEPLEWAPGLILKAESFISNYYMKD